MIFQGLLIENSGFLLVLFSVQSYCIFIRLSRFLLCPGSTGLPGVLWVLPDSYLDVPNKDYGGRHFISNINFNEKSAIFICLNFLIAFWSSLLLQFLNWWSGDLYINGKVIHRPQYRFNERQPTRNRARPRYDRRRETMQVERREPMQRQSWNQGQTGTMQQTPSTNNQNTSAYNGEGNHRWIIWVQLTARVKWPYESREINRRNSWYSGVQFANLDLRFLFWVLLCSLFARWKSSFLELDSMTYIT